MFNDKSVILSGLCSCSFSGYLGLLAHKRLYGRMAHSHLKTSLKLTLLRFLVIILLCLPFGIPFLVKFEAPIGVLIIVKGLVPALCVGYILFGCTHYFFRKFNLLNYANNEEGTAILLQKYDRNINE